MFDVSLQLKKWKNKQRVLVFCARGVTYRWVCAHVHAVVEGDWW